MRGIRISTAAWMVFAVSIAANLAMAADRKAASEKPDSERIVGTWIFDSSDKKFELIQNDEQKARLKFEDGKMDFALLQNGAAVFSISGNFTLDDTQTPKLLDITLIGDGAAPVFAIYEFDGEKLRVRIRDGGGQRPVDFATPADDCQTLTFKRDAVAK